MTDLRKAAERALEAFEMLDRRGGLGLDVHEYIRTKIEALRQALAQPEQGNNGSDYLITEANTPFVDAVNMSQERVDETAKHEHEPYGYLWFTNQMERRFTHYRPKEEQRIGEVTPIYTAPPKREWVGLSDEEVFEFADTNLYEGGKNYGILSFGKAIEAKLKEKNT